MIFAHLIQTASTLPADVSALETSISALESAVSALEIEIKTLEKSLPWEYAASVFTAVVVLGVALEFWVIRHDFRDELEAWAIWYFLGFSRLPSRPSLLKLCVEIASLVLITLGIAGELWVGVKTDAINVLLGGKSAELRNKNSELRSRSDQLLALVTQQAGNAATSAKTAREEAKAVKKEADEMLARVRVQGPRWKVLEDNRDAFIKAMKPFAAESSITTVRCGPVPQWEQTRVEADLYNFIGTTEKDSAGWKTASTDWPECPQYPLFGLVIVTSASATEPLHKSVTALKRELDSLSLATYPTWVDRSTVGVYRGNSPWAKAVSDPTTIFVLIAPNSMEDPNERPRNIVTPKSK